MDRLIDDFSKIPQRQKLGGLIGITVALGVLHYFLIYDDQSTQLTSKDATAKRLEAELVEKQAVADNLDRYKTEVRRLEVELERAKSLLPDESEVPALLAQISTLGARAGLEISRFEPQPEEQKDFYARLPFKLKVTGNYHDISVFIDSVGHLERIVNVENIGMRDPRMISKKYLEQTDFLVTTYRFLDRSGEKK